MQEHSWYQGVRRPSATDPKVRPNGKKIDFGLQEISNHLANKVKFSN